MRIYWIKAQAPRRVLALVKHLGVDSEFVEVDMMAGGFDDPAYISLNPNKKAPTLVDGNLVLSESSAIMAYLCIKYNSDMWPAHDPMEQVEVLRWLSWCDSHWSPAVSRFYFEHVVKATFGLGPPNKSEYEARIPDLMRYAAVLDGHLEEQAHVACGRLTIADFQLASMATYWREADMPLGSFHNIARWIDDLVQLPAWANPWPLATSTQA